MKPDIKKIIKSYLEKEEENSKEAKAQTKRTPSPYVEPLNKNMPNYPYYQDQEVSDVHLQIDSPHGGKDEKDKRNDLDKMFVYPEQDWQNVDWGYGDYTSPYENNIQKDFNRTPNTMENLYDPLRGASTKNMVSDLNTSTSESIDSFLEFGSDGYHKVAFGDLDNFLKVSDTTLIHKSKKDLWKMFTDKEGNTYISRLFEDGVLNEEE